MIEILGHVRYNRVSGIEKGVSRTGKNQFDAIMANLE